jgi:RNA recognition motif-containing protein
MLMLEDQVRYMFQTFGPIVDIKLQVEKGYAFVKYFVLM